MQFNNSDLDKMTVDELWSIHEEISAVLSERIVTQKRELEKRLAILRPGSDTAEPPLESRVAKPRKSRRKYPKVFPRYRNPGTAETWSGRGRRPRWLVAAEALGHTIDEFRILEPGGAGARMD
ncbi:MAG TPA: H-NS histone family protein [Roseiarcus sp.]|nr:H-NS histone family protein [Roseiarcus sp.]